MWLAIDIGNTNTALGLYDSEAIGQVHHWRICSDQHRTADEITLLLGQLIGAAGIEPQRIEGVVVGSVVPALSQAYREAVEAVFGRRPVEVSSRLQLDLRIALRDPDKIGADRLANAVAARQRYRGAVIVVDFGTATTFDVISGAGEYLGGAIAPGVRTSARDLFSRAAKLPRFVEIREPSTVIGKSTEESILSGLFYGTVGQVDGIVRRIAEQLEEKVTVVATGGLAHLIAPGSESIEEVCPDLTLIGLVLIGKRTISSG
jgi:type III pantothenate kinase